ncbi:hypothetical protein [Thermospira aquatica]|uniref:Lipoprotein n=1 Tax=Thermospira aquatica TaxID=2828656 RepID=A0AAX3BCV3_9SPIR|nr:hypothetical protein [Thermospira aquatica]URA10086.1 hypothetical protein KDW03_11480 [Thermospira aquatica]
MRRKWLLTCCSLLVLLFASCGRLIRPVEPFVYQFEVGKTYRYHLSMESQLSLEAGLVGYQGTVKLTASLYMTPLAFSNGQYLFQLLIRDVSLENADKNLSGAVYSYLNYLSTVFYEWYMTPEGRVTVYYRDLPIYPLQWLAGMVLVDVSHWDEITGRGEEKTTNFQAMFQNQEITVETSLFQRLVAINSESYTLEQRYTYNAYKQKAFPMANIDFQMETILNRKTKRIATKTGYFQFQGSVPFLQQGFLSLSARFQGMGKFILEEEPLQ